MGLAMGLRGRRGARRAGGVALLLALLAAPPPAAAETAPPRTAQLGLERLLPGEARARAAPAPTGAEVPFVIRFPGTVRGLEPGAAVEISGIRVGTVRSVALDFDAAAGRFLVRAGIGVQPERLPAVAGTQPRDAAETYAAFDTLARAGLRARPGSTGLAGGETIISLDAGGPPGSLLRDGAVQGGVPEIPAAPSRAEAAAERLQALLDRIAEAPVEAMIADLQEAMAALKALATGPELRETLAGLRDGAAELRAQVARLGARAEPVLGSLDQTARGATRTLATLERQLGERSPLLAELEAVLREAGGAARSLRLMAEYLERNPDALIRGKTDNRR